MKVAKRAITLSAEALDAEFLFYATLVIRNPSHFGGSKVARVLTALAKVSHQEERWFTFYPTARQAQLLEFARVVSLDGNTRYSGHRFSIEALEVWCTPMSTGVKQGIRFVSSFTGKPAELRIQSVINGNATQQIVSGTFTLDWCPVINAATSVMRSYTGNTRVKRVVVPQFTLKSGIRLRFVHHYESRIDGNDSISTSNLVAEFSSLRKQTSVTFASVLSDLESFLRLGSLASRQLWQCHRWQYSDGNATYTTHEYYNRVQLEGSVALRDNTLIDVSQFTAFARKTYSTFCKALHRELLDQAILVESTLKDRYTRMFSGLQGVLWFVYRNNGGTEVRVPIKKLFQSFMLVYSIDLSDLWPLFDSSRSVSLYDIRNAVAHGEYLSPSRLDTLARAEAHLQWTLERLILSVLKWPIERSRVRAESLRGWNYSHGLGAGLTTW